jgi:hypothetical protein
MGVTGGRGRDGLLVSWLARRGQPKEETRWEGKVHGKCKLRGEVRETERFVPPLSKQWR